MNAPLFRTQLFPLPDSEKLACVIAGLGGKIKSYQSLIQTLNGQGFAERAAGYKKIICIGASAGAGLCFALQRRMPAIQYGIYAVAGMSGKDAFQSPLFYFVRKKFSRRGFDMAKLNSLWREIDVSPDDPPPQRVAFVMVLGKRDVLVRYQKALATLHAWQQAGVPIRIIARPNLGHLGALRWHKKHIDELLIAAERLTAQP